MAKIRDKIVIKGGFVKTKIDNIHEHNMMTNTGCGAHRSKKDYRRKDKHQKRNYGY